MRTSTIASMIKTTNVFDIPVEFETKTSIGWKLSLQGKTINDALELYTMLESFIFDNKIPCKIATSRRINHTDKEQSKKVCTIYIPDNMDRFEIAEQVYNLTKEYKGWHNVKTPTSYEHYAGCVFMRNDRIDGNYNPAKA